MITASAVLRKQCLTQIEIKNFKCLTGKNFNCLHTIKQHNLNKTTYGIHFFKMNNHKSSTFLLNFVLSRFHFILL